MDINSIDWNKLSEMYDAAASIPEWLHQISSEDAQVRELAKIQLANAVCHQANLSGIAIVIIPILIELLRDDTILNKSDILSVLLSTASLSTTSVESVNKLMGSYGFTNVEAQAIHDRDVSIQNQVYLEMIKDYEQYLQILHSQSASDRKIVISILSNLKHKPLQTYQLLFEHLKTEPDRRVQAELLLSIPTLARDQDKVAEKYMHELRTLVNEENPFIRFYASLSKLSVIGVDESVTEKLQESFTYLQTHESAKGVENLVSDLSVASRFCDEAASLSLYADFIPIITVPEALFHPVYDSLMIIASSHTNASAELKRKAIRAIVNNDVLWGTDWLQKLLNQFDLPNTRDEFRNYPKKHSLYG